MNPGSQDSDYLSFDAKGNGNGDGPKNFRNNSQYRPYNRNRNFRQQNFRQQNFRQNQFMGGRNDGDGAQFSPNNFSSPVGGHQQRFDNGFRNRPNHFNQYNQNRRNFTPFKKFGGHGNQRSEVPIQQYFHASMLEDPWANCHQFNGTNAPEAKDEPVLQSENLESESNEPEFESGSPEVTSNEPDQEAPIDLQQSQTVESSD